jgi:hypothetical protein
MPWTQGGPRPFQLLIFFKVGYFLVDFPIGPAFPITPLISCSGLPCTTTYYRAFAYWKIINLKIKIEKIKVGMKYVPVRIAVYMPKEERQRTR